MKGGKVVIDVKQMTTTQLFRKRYDLEETIKICKDYLESCHSTFLGPLGAKVEIKKCEKAVKLIQAEIKSRY